MCDVPAEMAADQDDEPEEVLSEREQHANHAVRASVFGLIVWPLQAYAMLLLLMVFFSREKLEGRPRTNAKFAASITLPILLILIMVLVMPLVGPGPQEVDLRNLTHPEVLVGTWEGKFPSDLGEIRFVLELRRDGNVHYWESGAAEVDCTGTWAYGNWTFFVRYDRCLQGDSPWKGQIGGFAVEGFRETEMFFVMAPHKTRLTRRQ